MPRYAANQVRMRMAREASFGVAPSFGGDNTLWVRGRGDNFCSLRLGLDQRVMTTATGHGRAWLAPSGVERLVGRLETWALPATALELIEWATEIWENNTRSYTIEVDERHRAVRYLGVKARRLTISGGSAPQEQAVRLSYELVGKSQETIESLGPNAFSDDAPYTHKNAAVMLDGKTRADVSRWQVVVDNRLRVGSPSDEPTEWIDFLGRAIRANLTLAYDDATLVTAFESARAVELQIVTEHRLGAGYGLSLDLRSHVRIAELRPVRPLGGIAQSRLSTLALLTDPAGEDFRVSMN